MSRFDSKGTILNTNAKHVRSKAVNRVGRSDDFFGWEWNSCRVGISPTSPFRSVAFTAPLS